MTFGLIIVGDEILSGRRQDKHLSKVIEILAARGLQLAWCHYVGDEPRRITATLERAFAGGDIVFCTGGIGATPDDHTRQCAAAALGVGLALHPEAKALIEERMRDVAREQGVPYEPDRPDNRHRLNMGVFPVGARLIPNPYNKIPGFSCFNADRHARVPSPAGPPQGASAPSGGSEGRAAAERGGIPSPAGPPRGASAPSGGSEGRAAAERGGIHFVPGFPVMAWPMIEWVLDTHYAALFNRSPQVERSLIVYGAMEATLTPLMERIERQFAPVKVFSLPSVDDPVHGRHIDLGVKGAPELTLTAFAALKEGLAQLGAKTGPEMVR
jgi:molybdopterin-biosynthesis enzyme MoeA-like protein